ncbi:MAG TPA: hypothetical protein VNZ03_14885 [Terriglobales bacterium]|nr:hypothetical protein [Terriglobales bacterium]
MATVLGMSTAPGNYDNLDALTAAAPESAPAAVSDNLPPAPAAPATDFSFVAEGRPGVVMSGFLITVDDTLQLTVWNSNAALQGVTVQLRVLKPDGTLVIQQYTISKPTSDRTANVITATQLSGYLVGAVVTPQGGPLFRGQCFATLTVLRGTASQPLYQQTLLADYVSTGFQPTWPGSQLRSSTDGPGFVYTFTGAVPSQGNETTVVQPATTRWRVQTITAALTTNVAVANRLLFLLAQAGGKDVFAEAAAATQPASQSTQYTAAVDMPLAAVNPLNQTLPLPAALITAPATVFQTSTLNLQALDQWTALSVIVEEWINV